VQANQRAVPVSFEDLDALDVLPTRQVNLSH
jgi:hypothetical protein